MDGWAQPTFIGKKNNIFLLFFIKHIRYKHYHKRKLVSFSNSCYLVKIDSGLKSPGSRPLNLSLPLSPAVSWRRRGFSSPLTRGLSSVWFYEIEYPAMNRKPTVLKACVQFCSRRRIQTRLCNNAIIISADRARGLFLWSLPSLNCCCAHTDSQGCRSWQEDQDQDQNQDGPRLFVTQRPYMDTGLERETEMSETERTFVLRTRWCNCLFIGYEATATITVFGNESLENQKHWEEKKQSWSEDPRFRRSGVWFQFVRDSKFLRANPISNRLFKNKSWNH